MMKGMILIAAVAPLAVTAFMQIIPNNPRAGRSECMSIRGKRVGASRDSVYSRFDSSQRCRRGVCHMSSTEVAPAPSKLVTGTDRLMWAEGLSNTFDGTRYQFKNVDVTLCKGQKLGLVGVNGCGKSTILKVLGGIEPPDSGVVSTPKNTRIVYVEQEPSFKPGSTVLDAVYSSEAPVMKALRDYTAASARAFEDPDRFEKAMAAMEKCGGWEAEALAETIMTRLRVAHLSEQDTKTLSGGERKRVALAAALIQRPDVLILDEPTNHLDVEAIEWLEDLLSDRSLTCVLVTHDRWFLENVCQEILELDNGSMYRYPGSYEKFLELKADRMRTEDLEHQSAQNKLRRELEWVRKQPRARQAKSKSRVEAFHTLKSKVDGRNAGPGTVSLAAQNVRLGNSVLKFDGASLSFGERCLLDDFNYDFERGDSIGIVGANGVGKTTFLKVLLGEQPLTSGTITVGETVRYGYYRQQGMEELPEDTRVLKLVEDICAGVPRSLDPNAPAPPSPQSAARTLLGRFNFPNARWNDQVMYLSGGEKRRLQLLQVLASAPNLLLLDEVSNDLDIPTLNVLEDFLINEYKGVLVVVSHDRFFMDKITKRLFVFEGEGAVLSFDGTFTDYLDHRRSTKNDPVKAPPTPVTPQKASPTTTSTSSVAPVSDKTNGAASKTKLTFMEMKEYGRLEGEIEKLNQKIEEIQKKLDASHKAGVDYADMTEWAKEISRLNKEIETKEERWLELAASS